MFLSPKAPKCPKCRLEARNARNVRKTRGPAMNLFSIYLYIYMYIMGTLVYINTIRFICGCNDDHSASMKRMVCQHRLGLVQQAHVLESSFRAVMKQMAVQYLGCPEESHWSIATPRSIQIHMHSSVSIYNQDSRARGTGGATARIIGTWGSRAKNGPLGAK